MGPGHRRALGRGLPVSPGREPRHPSQLYEAALEGLLLLVVMQWLAWGRARDPAERGLPAACSWPAMAWPASSVEFFREPDAQLGYLLGGVTMGQLLSRADAPGRPRG